MNLPTSQTPPPPAASSRQQQQQFSRQQDQQYYQQLQQQHQLQQQQHHQQQQQHMMNGMNGGGGGMGGMPLPTPAGHQAELNYIYGMVEELSRQLAENRRVTEDIVSGLGRVRAKAKNQSLANGEVIDDAAIELNGNFCPNLSLVTMC